MKSSAQVASLASVPALDPRRWWALALLCGAFFMVILDSPIVIVALPSIEADLGFSEQGLQWVLSAYAVTFAGLLLLGGRAADLLGRRRVFMVGLLFFTAASLLCGLAWSPAALIAARAFQGVGAAIMTPTALSIISTTFPEGPERNKALGVWGMIGGIGATAGWLIGGPLVDGPGWEWIFFINIPLGLAALALSPVLLRESRATLTRRSYDPAGALTITGALVLLVYAVVEAPEVGWGDAQTILLVAGSAVLLAAFALIESRHSAPLVPLRILRSRTLVGANLVMLLFGTVAFGMPFILTLYAQQVLGYSALEFGLGSAVFAAWRPSGRSSARPWSSRSASGPVAATGHGADRRRLAPAHAGSVGGSYFGDIFFGLSSSAPASASPSSPSRSPRSRGRRARVRARLGPQQHRVPVRRRARRRHRHDGCRLPLRGLPGGERRREPARRAERGLPVRLPGLRSPGRDRRGAGAPAPRPAPGPLGRRADGHRPPVPAERGGEPDDDQGSEYGRAGRGAAAAHPSASGGVAAGGVGADNANERRTENGKDRHQRERLARRSHRGPDRVPRA